MSHMDSYILQNAYLDDKNVFKTWILIYFKMHNWMMKMYSYCNISLK